ncbi:hypothetical protein C8R45DRAFT_1208604 [Mycena sanguinolenta]|nr:hypothetical protein C8R45DRAFT_1208604 [Mycena sanguinolenta]
MSSSPAKCSTSSAESWEAFCSSANIVYCDARDGLLLAPIPLPAKLLEFIANGSHLQAEKLFRIPHISQAELDVAVAKREVKLVAEDPMCFELHMPHLCRLYSKFIKALRLQAGSEAAIRHAIDDVVELVFVADVQALATSAYTIETQVPVVKYNKSLVSRPNSIATAHGGISTRFPRQILLSRPDLNEDYVHSYVEYKSGEKSKGRQVVMNSATIQAVNRALGLTVKNYSFSVHRAQVDVIFSWLSIDHGHHYCYSRSDNLFALDVPIEWFRFFAFLCTG